MMIISLGRPSFAAVSISYNEPDMTQKSSLVASLSSKSTVIPVRWAKKNVLSPCPARYHPKAGTSAKIIWSPSVKILGTSQKDIQNKIIEYKSELKTKVIKDSIQ